MRTLHDPFTLRLDDLSQVEDIEQLDIGLHSEPCVPELHGTSITLSDLKQARKEGAGQPKVELPGSGQD